MLIRDGHIAFARIYYDCSSNRRFEYAGIYYPSLIRQCADTLVLLAGVKDGGAETRPTCLGYVAMA